MLGSTKYHQTIIQMSETESNLPRLEELAQYLGYKEQSNAYLAAIVNDAEEAILAKDLDGRITAWNPAAERLYGWKAEEAINRNVLELLVPEDKHEEFQNLMERLAKGERIPPFRTQRCCKDDIRIDVVLTLSPVRDMAGNVIGISSIAHPENWYYPKGDKV